jgi:hypothetical protein
VTEAVLPSAASSAPPLASAADFSPGHWKEPTSDDKLLPPPSSQPLVQFTPPAIHPIPALTTTDEALQDHMQPLAPGSPPSLADIDAVIYDIHEQMERLKTNDNQHGADICSLKESCNRKWATLKKDWL